MTAANAKIFQTVAIILGASLLLSGQKTSTSHEPKKLMMLAYIPYTGSEPADGKTCQAAMQIAVDEANGRPDILGDYAVEVVYRDEGSLAVKAPRSLIQFLSRFEGGNNGNSGEYQAPALVGTYYICQTISGIVRQFNMIEFATWCAGTIFTGDRKRFPNLYRQVTPQEGFFPSQLYLAKNIGQWREVGIVYFPENISEFLVAKMLYEVFEDNDISVVWFASVISFDNKEIIDSLVASKARVIYLGFYESPRLLAFLCLAYNQGVKAPRYAFVAYANAYSDPMSEGLMIPQGCTRTIIIEQLKAVLFVGNFESLVGVDNSKKTSMGYDAKEFERRLGELTNHSRTADYNRRYNCHDAMVHALIAMDHADKKLKKESNLSIMNFSTNPEIVMAAVNQCAARADYEGLQSRLWYSSDRFEADQRFQGIAQYSQNENSIRLLYRMWHIDNSSKTLRNLSAFHIEERQTITWASKSGRPTQDLSDVIHRQDAVEPVVFYIICVIVALSCSSACCTAVYIWRKPGVYCSLDFTCSIFTIMIGVFGENGAAVAFSAPRSVASCNAQLILASVGNSFVSWALLCEVVVNFVFLRNNMVSALSEKEAQIKRTAMLEISKQQKSSLQRIENSQTLMLANHMNDYSGRAKLLSTVPALVLNVVIFTAWFLITRGSRIVKISGAIFYDDAVDSYSDVVCHLCSSENFFYWELAIMGINLIPLVICAFIAYELGKRHIPSIISKDIFTLRIAALNSLTTFALVIITTLVLPRDSQRAAAWACGLIFQGNVTSILLNYRLIKARETRLAPLKKGERPSKDIDDCSKVSSIKKLIISG